MAFEAEEAVYQARKDALLSSEGQFVVIRGEELLGPYENYGDAYEQGRRAFDAMPFYIRQILRDDPVNYNPSIGVARNNMDCAWQYSMVGR
jgi:hypothetical protein